MRKNLVLAAAIVLTIVIAALAQHQHQQQSAQSAQASQDNAGAMDASATSMAGHHMNDGPHMKMTPMRAIHDGDQQKAEAVLAGARKAAEQYQDYHTALADGFRIFLPDVPQKMYHFTNYQYGFEAAFRLNPEHPTSLLYEKKPDGGYKFVGVMYTAPKRSSQSELDSRIPLSIAQWHAHTNFCAPPDDKRQEMFQPHTKWGLEGSITTQEECEKAGGKFQPQIFGWMVHVYPMERTQAEIWSVERQMDHEHGEHAGHN